MKKITAIIMLMLILCCISAEAKEKHTIMVQSETETGNTFISKDGETVTGWIRIQGKLHYAYKENHPGNPKGSLAKNTYRIRKGKMYYLGEDGAQVTKEMRYIAFNRDGSVHYIYPAGRMIRRERFNANHKRYQWLDDHGHWKDTGMQCWPMGLVDTKK